MEKVLVIYLKNFRVIHHLFFISLTFGSLKIISVFFSFFEPIFTINSFGIFLQLCTLLLCFHFNEKALSQSGLTDEFMLNELEKCESKDTNKRRI